MFTKVKNLIGTSQKEPKIPYSDLSWLEYWEKRTGEKACICANISCMNKAEHGAHVRKCDSLDSRAYIVPLCAKCNNPNNKEEFVVSGNLCEA